MSRPGPITADWRIDDTIRRYPGAGPIFIQHGRMYVARSTDLYPSYPGLTVAEYASLNGIAVESLLRLLNAVADGEPSGERPSAPSAPGPEFQRGRRLPLVGTVGYTGSSRDPHEGVVEVPMVWSLEARGPD